jgi:hypothetical protein
VWSLFFFVWSIACSLSYLDLLAVAAGACVIRSRMLTRLAEAKQEQNAALLKVIKKEGTIGFLLEQLQSECQALTPSSPFFANPP